MQKTSFHLKTKINTFNSTGQRGPWLETVHTQRHKPMEGFFSKKHEVFKLILEKVLKFFFLIGSLKFTWQWTFRYWHTGTVQVKKGPYQLCNYLSYQFIVLMTRKKSVFLLITCHIRDITITLSCCSYSTVILIESFNQF